MPFQPAAPETLEPLQTADAEADGEGEVEERDGESRPEVRKKRSRRSRGGRRKNGRAATGATGPELADEDDDDLDDELPAQQFPAAPPPPAPQQLVPRAARGGESYVISGSDLDSMSREIIISVPDRQRPQHEERKIAVFCDFENIALGVRDSEISKFDIGLILERLLEKGKIIVKKAYADWERYSDYKRPFHEAAIELIDIPQKFYSGKNSADIKMVVDAMDLSYSKEHLDTFVILSGDSDFSPLVSKLKENNKYVIGIGVKNSSSNLLVDNCDEFIYYEDIWRDAQKGPKLDGLSKKTAEAFSLMVESIQALVRENKDVLWGSMIKQTMQRKKPSFNEGYYGYSTFSELLEDAERKNIVKLKKDQRSGTYIVTGFAKSGDAGPGRRQA
ncbi:MAG TPA: NYN domain-containing protein [Thermoanaerobaculia bacterium]|nr:NYN domain-containing protein [Thermoanaerobaculia bacterium]